MVLSREVTARIRQVLEKHPEGISITDLVRSVDINRNTAGRYLENLLLSGQVEMRRFGMAKMYSLTKRLPVSSVLSLSSELVLQLDAGQRVFYANDTLLSFIGIPADDLFGKNIEFTPFAIVFEEVFPELLDRIGLGLRGEEWRGELSRTVRGKSFLCRITPTVYSEGRKGVSVILEDISDRKRDEERIRSSEARLRSIFMASPVGIGLVSGRVLLEVNDRLCEMTGYAAGELIGKSARLLYPTLEEFERVGTHVYNQEQRSRTGSVEAQWVRKDGKMIDVLLNTSPIDPANISAGITFTALDITARNLSGQALKESEDRYRTLAEASQDLIFVVGRDDSVEYVNSYAAAIWGMRADQVIGKKRSSLFPREEGQRQADGLRTVFETGKAGHSEGPMEIFGTLHWFDHYLMPVKDPHGTVTSVLGVSRDITARRNAEQALKESEDRYRKLVEISPDAVILHQEGKIIYVNPALVRLLRARNDDDLLGKNVLDFIRPEFREAIRQNIDRDLSGRTSPPAELEMIRADGTTVVVSGRGVGTFIDGKPAVLVVVNDITDRHEAEQALKESESTARALLNAPTDTVILVDSSGVILDLNETAAQRLKKKREDLVGTLADTALPPDLAQERRRKISGVITTKEPTRFIDEHGSLWFDNVVYPILDDQGKVYRLAIIARDITDQKKAEAALRESEDRYRSVFENTGAATAILEKNTVVSLMNSEFERISGYTKQEIEKKKSWADFVAKEDVERMLAWHYQRREGGDAPHQYEAGVIRKDGEIRRALITVGLIMGTSQSVVSLIDITDRKAAEDALRASGEQYRFIADNSLDIITRQTPECICTYVSPSVTVHLGYRVMDVLNTSVLSYIHPDDLPTVRHKLARIQQDKTPHITSTFRMRHRDGNYLWFESLTRIIRDEKTGNLREFISISRDVTARMQRGEEGGQGLG